jgi:tetratricopeptide (TPR) repeat protein
VAAADVLPLISSLVGKSMLVADVRGYEPRYFMLEPFREYAHEKLTLQSECGAVGQRHALAYVDLAKRFVLRTQHHSVFHGQAVNEIGNWRAAVHWAVTERNDVLAGQCLVAEVVCLWGGRDEVRTDAERWVPAALALVDERTPSNVLAKLKLAEARLAMDADRQGLQLASAREAISYFREAGDEPSLMLALTYAGNALADLGRGSEARTIVEEALSLARKLDARWWIANILRNLATACIVEHDLVATRACLTECLHLIEAEDDPYELDLASEDLAELAFAEGDPESAVRYMTNRVARQGHAGGRYAAVSQVIISAYLIALDRYEEAEHYSRDALIVAREAHLDVLASQALGLLASTVILKPCRSTSDRASRDDRATRLLGFVDARITRLGAAQYSGGTSAVYCARERAFRTLHERMNTADVAELMAEGGKMSEGQAAALASTL